MVDNLNELNQAAQLEEMKRQVLGKILTKEAFERLSRVRMVNPNLAGQAELYLLQIYQAGKITGKITDEKIKGVLKVLSEDKKMRIRRR